MHVYLYRMEINIIIIIIIMKVTRLRLLTELHKLAAAHLQAPERQIGDCTPMKTVSYNKFNNNT